MRDPAREEALRSWERYKLDRQVAAQGGRGAKGAHMGALISRTIDLTGSNLDAICVGYADLRGAILDECSLKGAWLKGANLENASLRHADLSPHPSSGRGAARLLYAFMRGADLTAANCQGVDFSFASLNDATLSQTILSDSNLSHTSLVRAGIDGAILVNSRVYGIAAWDLKGSPAIQQDLIITQEDTLGDKGYYYVLQESERARLDAARSMVERGIPKQAIASSPVRLDNLELAQFVNLLLRNDKIRDVINTIGQKGVLILGRFTEERKIVLDSIRTRLRQLGYLPMMFDFERPTQRDFTETIKTLAGLSRFIIADITNPKSSPLELQAIMPDYMIPFVPIIQENEEPFAMFRDLKQKYGEWVLDVLKYDCTDNLVKALDSAVIKPALERSQQLMVKKAEAITTRHIRDYI
jgi:uncharacterized protein YjbI with pentapeptide repeats